MSIRQKTNSVWLTPQGGALLLFLLAVAVYLPVLRGGLIMDDSTLIMENRMVRASDGLYRFWFTSESQDYRPLTWSLWWLEWRLWDGNPTGYHVVNVLFHAVNCVLVWFVLRRLGIPGAWFVAAVFAIHPVNVATGAWISEQKNTLSMLFYALSILLYLKFDEQSRWVWYGGSLTAFLLALLTKTAVVMLPVVLLGCLWWRHGRVRPRHWWCLIPYFAGALVLSLVTIVQHHRALEGNAVQTGGFAARLATAGWIPWFYLSKALLPINLTMIYPKWNVDGSRWGSYIPGLVLLGSLALFWWKRGAWGRPLFFGLGYFVTMLFPVLGFFDQAFYRYSWVADHWQYYSIIGVIALIVAAGINVGHRIGPGRQSLGMLVSAAVLVALGMAAWKRSEVYENAETLWRDNISKSPTAWVAEYNLAVVLRESHRIQEAIPHYQGVVRIVPDMADGHYGLGVAWGQIGKSQAAIEQYEQALRIEPHYTRAQNNLAWLLATLAPAEGGDPVRAVALAKSACERAGNELPDMLDTLAVAYAATGQFHDAVATSERAIELALKSGRADLAKEIEGRLQIYRVGRPYRPPVRASIP